MYGYYREKLHVNHFWELKGQGWIAHTFWLVFTCDLLEDWCIDDIFIKNILLFLWYKQIDFMLPWICTEINYRRHQILVRISEIHSLHGNMKSICYVSVWHHSQLQLNRENAIAWMERVSYQKQQHPHWMLVVQNALHCYPFLTKYWH